MSRNKFYDNQISDLRNYVFDNDKFIKNELNELFFYLTQKLTNRGGRVLDIGTGNAYVLSELNKRFLNYFYLYGIDISKEMLVNNHILRGQNINLMLGNNYELPCKNNSFDTVTAKNVTRFSQKEIYRVLKEKGHFIMREYGIGKGLLEISELFQNRLIRVIKPKDYVYRLEKIGFQNIFLKEFTIKRKYNLLQILNIVEMFPFIKDYSKTDKNLIIELFKHKKEVEITSDPILIIAQK